MKRRMNTLAFQASVPFSGFHMDFLLGVLAEVARGFKLYLKKYLSKLFSFLSNGMLPVFVCGLFLEI